MSDCPSQDADGSERPQAVTGGGALDFMMMELDYRDNNYWWHFPSSRRKSKHREVTFGT